MVEETRSRAQNAGFQNMEAGIGAADKDQVSADFSLEIPWENYVDCVGILRIFWVAPTTLQQEVVIKSQLVITIWEVRKFLVGITPFPISLLDGRKKFEGERTPKNKEKYIPLGVSTIKC